MNLNKSLLLQSLNSQRRLHLNKTFLNLLVDVGLEAIISIKMHTEVSLLLEPLIVVGAEKADKLVHLKDLNRPIARLLSVLNHLDLILDSIILICHLYPHNNVGLLIPVIFTRINNISSGILEHCQVFQTGDVSPVNQHIGDGFSLGFLDYPAK